MESVRKARCISSYMVATYSRGTSESDSSSPFAVGIGQAGLGNVHPLLRPFHTAFHLPYRIEVFVKFLLIVLTEIPSTRAASSSTRSAGCRRFGFDAPDAPYRHRPRRRGGQNLLRRFHAGSSAMFAVGQRAQRVGSPTPPSVDITSESKRLVEFRAAT